MRILSSIVLVVATLPLFTSCSLPELTHQTYYIDYELAGNGAVFITESNSVSFEYVPLGSILVEEIPGTVKTTVALSKREQRNNDSLYGDAQTKTVNAYEEASAQSALNYAAKQVISLGGDGLINVKLDSYLDRNNKRIVQVSGMAIKRK